MVLLVVNCQSSLLSQLYYENKCKELYYGFNVTNVHVFSYSLTTDRCICYYNIFVRYNINSPWLAVIIWSCLCMWLSNSACLESNSVILAYKDAFMSLLIWVRICCCCSRWAILAPKTSGSFSKRRFSFSRFQLLLLKHIQLKRKVNCFEKYALPKWKNTVVHIFKDKNIKLNSLCGVNKLIKKIRS
jgi:hypothetical protein